MRSPSERLTELLTSSGLCSPAELERCEPIVRQLCHDLPDFDSVWLDALVQQRILTPWQGDEIQADRGDQLTVGRFQCQQPLGQATFLAIDVSRRKPAVLRLLGGPRSLGSSAAEKRIEEIVAAVDRSRSSAPASLTLPVEIAVQRKSEDGSVAQSDNGNSYLVAPYIRGWSMEELLIRGGRLPVPVVAEIGRELLTSLSWLESVRLLHGDLLTRNVRLAPRGSVHLTAPFVRRLQQPHFALTEQLTLRDCEGIAPEQVGTGRMADARSELYALGCLLWQLLTSRPVVLTADPVTRLMKQKDHDIVDVRIPVPDCPEWMSRIILSLTRRSPELRPASAAEVLKQWRTHSGNGLGACKALARSMPDHSLRSRTQLVRKPVARKSTWIWPATATAVLATLVVLSARSGVIPKTLQLNTFQKITAALTSTADNAAEVHQPSASGPSTDGPVPLPAVDVDGIIRLEAGREYLAEPREFVGSLQILCSKFPTAKILIRDDARWQLRARAIVMQGVTLSQRPAVQNNSDASVKATQKMARQMLEVQCTSLAISDCVIQSPAGADNFQGIEWRRPNSEIGIVMIRNTVFAGGGYGLSLNHPPHRCELENVLFANRGSGLLCEFQKGDAESWDLLCTNVTQRFGFSLLDAVVQKDSLRHVQINLTSSECVYSPQMAIVRLQAPESMRPEAMRIEFRSGETGNPAVVPPDTRPAVYIDRRLNQPVSLPDAQVTDTSLLLAELLFNDQDPSSAHSSSSEWTTAALFDFEGPKLTPVMPGIDPARLPSQTAPRN